MGKGHQRTVAEGRMVVPNDWPKWKKKCGRKNRFGQPCNSWCVRGMPTCRMHGSGGERNRTLGELRYLCWVIAGGPANMPLEHAVKVSLAVWAEHTLNNAPGNPDQQMKAALWLMQKLG